MSLFRKVALLKQCECCTWKQPNTSVKTSTSSNLRGAMSAGHHFHGMFRQNSLPRVDLSAAPDRMGPAAPNAKQFFPCGFWAEGFPHQLAAPNSWSTWAPCGHDMGRRRWTQPVHGSHREMAPVVGRASLPAQSPQFHNQHYASYLTVATPRALGCQVSAPQVTCAGPAARSASVGALRPLGSELSHPAGPGRPAGVSHSAIPGRAPNVAAVSTLSAGLLTERMDRMPGTKPPGLSASQSWQPCEGPRLNSESLTRGTFELQEDPAQEANSQPEAVVRCHGEPPDAAQPGSPCRSADSRPQFCREQVQSIPKLQNKELPKSTKSLLSFIPIFHGPGFTCLPWPRANLNRARLLDQRHSNLTQAGLDSKTL